MANLQLQYYGKCDCDCMTLGRTRDARFESHLPGFLGGQPILYTVL